MDVESFYDGYLAAAVVEESLSAPVGFTISLLSESEEEIAEIMFIAFASDSATSNNNTPKVFDELPSPTKDLRGIIGVDPMGGQWLRMWITADSESTVPCGSIHHNAQEYGGKYNYH